MSVAANRRSFLDSAEAVALREELMDMVTCGKYNTGAIVGFEATFIEKHLNYISRFSYIDPHQYIMNLKVKSRI